VVALFAFRLSQEGDHKGRPYSGSGAKAGRSIWELNYTPRNSSDDASIKCA
jgi:hypothetical protein